MECSDPKPQEAESFRTGWNRALADKLTSSRPGGLCLGTLLSDLAENFVKRCQGVAGAFVEVSFNGLEVGRLDFITAVNLQFA